MLTMRVGVRTIAESRPILATGVRTGVRMDTERACFVGWLVGCKRPVSRLHPSHPASLQSGLFCAYDLTRPVRQSQTGTLSHAAKA